MKILIAEDDRATRLRIVKLLEQWGHEIVSAVDGSEAWQVFQQERPDLVLTDWLMPGLDGLQLVERIRALGKSGRYVYLIMLTSRTETADLVKGIEAGADDFVGKPFANDELRARIRAGVRIIELERALARKNRSLASANASITETNRRMQRELETAARIQSSFLPAGAPKTDLARFAWHYEPCEEMSGDTLNILPLDDGRFGLYVVDVCGHGVSAALLSVHVSRLFTKTEGTDSILRHSEGNGNGGEGKGRRTRTLEPPAAVAAHLNRLFPCQPRGGELQYFTLLYGILDLRERRFDYTSAGHPGPIVVPSESGADARILEACPPAVGFFPEAEFAENSVSLDSGDRLYLYTDGIFEVFNPEGEEFGESRLAGQLAREREGSLEESILQTLRATRRWCAEDVPDDDVSLLGVEIA